MAEESLKNKTLKGVGWSAADAFIGQGITFVVGIVLARLLSPSEYGLIGICLIFNTVLGGIVDSGFSNALIRKKEVSDDDYNTMFITNIVMSFVLFTLLFFLAPTISVFFNRFELTSLIRAMGLILIFQALSITQVTFLTRKLDFKTKTKASLVSAFASGIIGIGMALGGLGVWSLVIQRLSLTLLYSLMLCFFNKWFPSLRFDLKSFKYMWEFGWKLMLSGLLANIWNQLYQVVVGKCYSPSTLGQYSRSKEYANIFSAQITSIVQRVSYPVLAQIQDTPERLIDVYRQIIKTTMFITCVCMIFMGAVAEPLVYCLIGSQWREAATYLPLICINMSLYPLHAINLNMLQVQGRSDLYLYIEIVKKVLSLIPIFMGVFVGIYSMLIASIGISFICFFLNSYYTGKKLGYSSWMQLKDIAPNYGISFIIAIAVYFLKFLSMSFWIILPIQIIFGFVIGLIICETSKLTEYLELKKIMLNILNNISRK